MIKEKEQDNWQDGRKHSGNHERDGEEGTKHWLIKR